MAKRFTDTNKYKKPFIRGLQGAYKLLWDFLYHDCDHAGVWIVDFETAQIFIGKDMPVNYEDAIKYFNSGEVRIVVLDSGARWFLPSFIEFQYGKLSEKNRLHVSVISILSKYDLLDESFNLKVNKPLTSPLQGAKDKDKEQYKDKEKDKDKETPKTKLEIVMPFQSPIFIQAWDNWKTYRKQSGKPYRSELSEQAALKKLSNYPEDVAIKMIEESIANSWQGIFELKNQTHGKQNADDRTKDLINGFAQRASQVLNK